MNDILGIQPRLEGLHDTVTKDNLRKKAFRRLLSAVLADTLPIATIRPYSLVNLGCRRGNDTDDIAACFEEATTPYKHTAIDCDDEAIKYATTSHPDQNTTYICANAADPYIVHQYPEEIDLILLRHPEVWQKGDDMWSRNDDIWYDIVSHAWSRSNQQSQVLITVYNETEYKLVERTFARLPNTVIIESTINPHRDETLTQWNHRTDTLNCPDHYVLRLKKKTK